MEWVVLGLIIVLIVIAEIIMVRRETTGEPGEYTPYWDRPTHGEIKEQEEWAQHQELIDELEDLREEVRKSRKE